MGVLMGLSIILGGCSTVNNTNPADLFSSNPLKDIHKIG